MAIGRSTIVVAPARVDRRTKDLLKRVRPGEIAVVDHTDLDRVAAEGLIKAGVGAVVNAAASFTGRYPNSGPLLITQAGIPLIDKVGPGLLDDVTEGEELRVDGTEVWRGGEPGGTRVPPQTPQPGGRGGTAPARPRPAPETLAPQPPQYIPPGAPPPPRPPR